MNRDPANVVQVASAPEALRVELADRIGRRTASDGVHQTAVPGLALIRASTPSAPLPVVYHPSICVVVQGSKCALLGAEVYRYDPLHYLIVSLTLPMRGQILQASVDRPYLCVRIGIDAATLADLTVQSPTLPATASDPNVQRALLLARIDSPLLDAVLRLVRLLETPVEAAVLAPLILREIHYRVLAGELGPRLREFCALDGANQRIGRAIELLKARYAQPLRVDDLAASVHMAASTFHHRFKAATAMTPMQFQKQLRLQEARRLMLADGLDAAVAGHRVGYQSPSQFSRDYRRLFGAPPRREVDSAMAAVPPVEAATACRHGDASGR